ncbi:hypothetical protein LCGC14_0757410 [marine sediment metagenome]|uniref:Thymidylate synthase (FAD) n=1 Tax=marine sediment metagenome TaxID=412755 RepID=A0A0F9Q6A1_9ZZZZ
MADYGTEVILKGFTPDAETRVEEAGRVCYATEEKTGMSPGWLRKRIEQGHESLFEHASASFLILCSRVVSHQLVRHRLAAYSQRSQRYVPEKEERYITPASFLGRPKLGMVFREIMKQCWDAYRCLLELGADPEDARYALPNATETQIICTWNFREIRHIIRLRTSTKAGGEMQEVAGKVRDICVEKWPSVFGDLKVSEGE